MLDLFALSRTNAQRLQQDIAFDLKVAPRHDVVQHAHAFEQSQVLKSARYAHGGHFMAVHVFKRLAAKGNAAFLRLVHTVNTVQHGRFACAVRPNDGANFMLAHIKADVRQCLDTTKAQRNIFDV